MLFLANIGRRLMKMRIAGMVAEINLARTPDGIQVALRRALKDPSLVIQLWSREHEQYLDTDGRFVGGDSPPHRLMVDVLNPDGSASVRMVAMSLWRIIPNSYRLQGKRVEWRCTIQRCKPAFWQRSNRSRAPES
jgi:hypothetical protein